MARCGRGCRRGGRGPDFPKFPRGGPTQLMRRPPAHLDVGSGCRGPVPTGTGICGPKVEQGNLSQPASGIHCPDGSGHADPGMVFPLESAELPPPSARHGHRSRARPTRRVLAAWPGGTPPPYHVPASSAVTDNTRSLDHVPRRVARRAPGKLAPLLARGGSRGREPGAGKGGARARLPPLCPQLPSRRASLFLLEHPPPPLGSWEEEPESGLQGGLGSNGTKLSVVVLLGKNGVDNYTTGSLGQNSDGVALPLLHRINGQSGDGQHD